ncbi:MAG: hypothetical protein NWR72_16030 [Bacteroidia bacterium]|nr:hypothetical protein [Bacteroidia bacterium]
MKSIRFALSFLGCFLVFSLSMMAGTISPKADKPSMSAQTSFAPSATGEHTSGPSYLAADTHTKPWAGLMLIPFIALVFLFPVIVAKLFPGLVPQVASQRVAAQP